MHGERKLSSTSGKYGGVRWACNVGSEHDGINDTFERPVVVIRNFNGRILWIVPLTRTFKPHNPYHFPLQRDANGVSAGVVSQLRLIGSKRLIRKIGTLDDTQYELVYWVINLLKDCQ
jgi:mRNA-degrading endonuclease toxin of MazEF toxin-antitoxin module